MNVLLEKVKEVLYAVLPIVVIVLVLNFTAAPMPGIMIGRFIIGAVLIILGLSVFLFGVDIGISPLGSNIGGVISKSNKLWIVIAVGLVLGFFISIAEPDLQILARQVAEVTGGKISNVAILIVVSVGIAVMLVSGLVRIVYNFPLHIMLTIVYGLIFLLAVLVSPEFLAISFDASGATTGALTVPFILALAVGVSSLKKDSMANESDSFGLVAIASAGAIIGVMLLGIISNVTGMTGNVEHGVSESSSLIRPFFENIPGVAFESAVALLPLLLIYIAFQVAAFKFNRKQFRKILKGLLYTFIGLVLFMTGVHTGFMDVGTTLGYNLAMLDNKVWPVAVGFILGFVTVMAEPAVYALTHQIQDVTSGYVNRKIVMAALAIGVGAAVGLSILKTVVPGIKLWHYLLPGYIISVTMSFFVPKLFVGIAFDSGGVASGPMTATFTLAFAQGVAAALSSDVLQDAFGVIALVAMTPIITLQILGLIVMIKSRKKGGIELNA